MAKMHCPMPVAFCPCRLWGCIDDLQQAVQTATAQHADADQRLSTAHAELATAKAAEARLQAQVQELQQALRAAEAAAKEHEQSAAEQAAKAAAALQQEHVVVQELSRLKAQLSSEQVVSCWSMHAW
jgi:chromosome segregation ATPase